MVKLSRWLKHVFMPPWRWRMAFPRPVLNEIEKAVRCSELQHRGELRFAIENGLSPGWVWHGMTGRYRAMQVFSNLRVWDTEENCGVLIYVELADREVHIVADRGVSKCVPQAEWEKIARIMQQAFKNGEFKQGSVKGIEAITEILTQNYPATQVKVNELPNRPVIVKN